MTTTKQENKEQILQKIVACGKSQYPHILLYNSILDTDEARDGIASFSDIHANLMGLHGFMAGFQFIALEDNESIEDMTDIQAIVFTMRVCGFLFSLLGTLISLITMEFLKSIEKEPTDLQVEGVLKYSTFFRHSDLLGIATSILLTISTNIVLYESLPYSVCIVLNAITAIVSMYFLYMFKTIIIDKQQLGSGRHLYQNKQFQNNEEDVEEE